MRKEFSNACAERDNRGSWKEKWGQSPIYTECAETWEVTKNNRGCPLFSLKFSKRGIESTDTIKYGMEFEWDPRKAKQNLGKHGISFDEAVTVFYDPLSATFDDPDHSLEEQRHITMGFSSQNHLLLVAHTGRGENIRIISARPATAHERKKHEEKGK